MSVDLAEALALRAALACFPSGVTAVCAMVDGRPCGLAASSFTSVSLDPPLVSVCVARTSETWPLLATAPRIGVSVLAEGQAEVARDLARKGVDRFTRVGWIDRDGAVVVEGATLQLECTLDTTVPTGDHDIAVLRIRAAHSDPDVAPMVFHGSRFRTLHPHPPADHPDRGPS